MMTQSKIMFRAPGSYSRKKKIVERPHFTGNITNAALGQKANQIHMHKILTLGEKIGINVNIFKFETKMLNWLVAHLTMLLESTLYTSSLVLFYMKGGMF
jgi:hypothetical protein